MENEQKKNYLFIWFYLRFHTTEKKNNNNNNYDCSGFFTIFVRLFDHLKKKNG